MKSLAAGAFRLLYSFTFNRQRVNVNVLNFQLLRRHFDNYIVFRELLFDGEFSSLDWHRSRSHARGGRIIVSRHTRTLHVLSNFFPSMHTVRFNYLRTLNTLLGIPKLCI